MRLMNMTPSKIQEYFNKSDLALFCVGSIENHGYHNPLGVDTLIPNRILELVEEKSEVLIAPTLPYGSADAHLGFPGTISLGHDVLFSVVNRVVECLCMMGARRILFINGHAGNLNSYEKVGLAWYKKGLLSANISWWTLLPSLNPEWKGGHGCMVETSAVMYIDPSLVDLSLARDMGWKNEMGDEFPSTHFRTVNFKGAEIEVNRPTKSATDNGWVGPNSPSKSSAKFGEEILTAVSDYIVSFIEVFKRAKLPPLS